MYGGMCLVVVLCKNVMQQEILRENVWVCGRLLCYVGHLSSLQLFPARVGGTGWQLGEECGNPSVPTIGQSKLSRNPSARRTTGSGKG